MTGRKPPRVRLDTPIGPDVDLDREEVRLADGSRLTREIAAEIVEEVRRGGRPSLSGSAQQSPQIAFRVPAGLRDRAARLAAREGKTVSQLAREALERRVSAAGMATQPKAGPSAERTTGKQAKPEPTKSAARRSSTRRKPVVR